METFLAFAFGLTLGVLLTLLANRLFAKAGEDLIPFVQARAEQPEAMPTGIFYPSEEDTADFLNERMILQDHEIINPYSGWDIYNEKEG